jgi:hypothetical protein
MRMLSEKQLKKLEIQDWSRLTKDFNKADLLLGNGFSLNITGHLAYRSLFEEFLNRCGENECKIFKSFKTSNFERIQEILIDAKRVNQLFKIATKDNRINKAIDLLKEGLIQSIQKNHPNFSQLDLKQLHSLSIQLNDYGDIFGVGWQ